MWLILALTASTLRRRCSSLLINEVAGCTIHDQCGWMMTFLRQTGQA